MSRAGSDAGSASSGKPIQRFQADVYGVQDLLDQMHSMQVYLFEMLQVLTEHRWDRQHRYAVLRVVVDWLQLFLLMVSPAHGWALDTDLWLWQAIEWVQFRTPVANAGYWLWQRLLYIIIGIMLLSAGAAAYAVRSSGRQGTWAWPQRVLRAVCFLFFDVCYVGVLSIIFMGIDCQLVNIPNTSALRMRDAKYVECLALPHLAQACIAAVTAIAYICMCALWAAVDFDLSLASKRLLGSVQPWFQLRMLLLRTGIAVVGGFLGDIRGAQAIVFFFLAGALVFEHVRWVPLLNTAANHTRAGLYGALWWVSFMLIILSFDSDKSPKQRQAVTTVTFAVMAPAGLVAAACAHGFLVWMTRKPRLKFSNQLSSNTFKKDVWKFQGPWQVEIVARCVRQWVDEETLDEGALALAEAIIKGGIAQYPNNAHLTLLHANFLIECAHNYGAGTSLLRAARKMDPGRVEKYVIYLREQEHVLMVHNNSASETTLDLVSYVEFQRNFRLVMRSHRDALNCTRNFWKNLLKQEVPFGSLYGLMRDIPLAAARADRTYRMVLERYPTSVKVLRCYARFLEDVQNDPWSAARIHAEADKQESQQELAQDSAVFTDDPSGDNTAALLAKVDERSNAVCIINAEGAIQMANKLLLRMFGYKKAEVEGKNVSMLMPAPFSTRHNTYLRNYTTTGKAKILDRVQSVVALHKERYVFPVKLAVTRISGSGSDSVFMGVLAAGEEDPSVTTAWALPTGSVLCVDTKFGDLLGKGPGELVGRPFISLLQEPDRLQALLDAVEDEPLRRFDPSAMYLDEVHLYHKYTEPVAVSLQLSFAGTESQRILVLSMRRKQPGGEYLMVTDARGRISYATSHLAALVGHSPKAMKNMDVCRLIPQPMGLLHGGLFKIADTSARPPIHSCRSGAPVTLLGANKAQLPCSLVVSSKEVGDELLHVVAINRLTPEAALAQVRLTFTVDTHGVILSASDTPAKLFGFQPRSMVGRSIALLLDLLQPTKGDQARLMAALEAMYVRSMEEPGVSWRVAVATQRELMANAEEAFEVKDRTAGAARPAVLSLEVQRADEEEAHHDAHVITLHLWRAEMVAAVVEVDATNHIQRVLPGMFPPGLLFGLPTSELTKKALHALMSVPTMPSRLLPVNRDGEPASKWGPKMNVAAKHSDGQPLKLTVQATVKEGHSSRLLVRLSFNHPAKASPYLLKQLLGEVPPPGAKPEAAPAAALPPKQPSPGAGAPGAPKAPPSPGSKPPGGAGGGVKFGGKPALRAAMDEDDSAAEMPLGGEGEEESEGEEDASVASFDDELNPGALSRIAKERPKASRIEEWIQTASTDEGGFTTKGESELTYDSEAPFDPSADLAAADLGPDKDTDDGSASNEGSSSAASSDEQGITSDFRRGKRCRKLRRRLDSRSRAMFRRLKWSTAAVLLLLVVAHVACFVAALILLEQQSVHVEDMDQAGDSTDFLHKAVLELRVVDMFVKGQGGAAPNLYGVQDVKGWVGELDSSINELKIANLGVFIGFKTPRRLENTAATSLRDIWEQPNRKVTRLVDVSTPYTVDAYQSLWEASNEFITASQDTINNYQRYTAAGQSLSSTRDWFYAWSNGPAAVSAGYLEGLTGLLARAELSVSAVNMAMLLLLGLEGVLCSCVAVAVMWHALGKAFAHRLVVFDIFMGVTTSQVRALSSKPIVIDEDDEGEDSDSEAGDQPPPAGAAQPLLAGNKSHSPAASRRGTGEHHHHHKHNHHGHHGHSDGHQQQQSSRVGAPVSVQGGADGMSHDVPILPIGRRTFQQHLSHTFKKIKSYLIRAETETVKEGEQRRTRRLLPSSRGRWLLITPFLLWVLVLFAVYIASQQLLVALTHVLEELNDVNILKAMVERVAFFAHEMCLAASNVQKDVWRGKLRDEMASLKVQYNHLLYASNNPGGSTVMAGTADAELFFPSDATRRCFREDQSTCFPSSHPYYDVSHRGINGMMERLQAEAALLLLDGYAALTPTNGRLDFIWRVGLYDLHEGLAMVDASHVAKFSETLAEVRLMHIALLVVLVVLAGAMALGVYRPFVHRLQRDMEQAADLLSQLPADADVEAMVSAISAGDSDHRSDDGSSEGSFGASGKGGKRDKQRKGG